MKGRDAENRFLGLEKEKVRRQGHLRRCSDGRNQGEEEVKNPPVLAACYVGSFMVGCVTFAFRYFLTRRLTMNQSAATSLVKVMSAL